MGIKSKRKICVVGCGYIGLPTSAMFASHNCSVLAVDTNIEIVSALNKGLITIEEPGLGELVADAVRSGNLIGSTEPKFADAFIVAVPTPNLNNDAKGCDLSFVIDAVRSILPFLKPGNTIIIESTVSPRSTDDHIAPILESSGWKIGTDIFLAHCPERVLPGKILSELEHNNRIIGGFTPRCAEEAANYYRLFVKGEILLTEAKTAEMAKCMENTFRDVNIALANELSKVCNELDINSLDVISLANKHPRVNIHNPGPGVGGHCLAIDPYFISAEAPDTAKLISLSRAINKSMPAFTVDSVKRILQKASVNLRSAKISVLGLAYKGNVDDCRESPALDIIKLLASEGFELSICDPHVLKPNLSSLEHACDNSDIALVLTDHDQFKGNSLAPLVRNMRHPIVFDTRNIVHDIENATVINYGNLYSFI